MMTFEQLETDQLFVETFCPKCGRFLLTLAPDAGKIRIFGCIYCTDIEESMLLSMDKCKQVKAEILA